MTNKEEMEKPDFKSIVESFGWYCDGTAEANDMLKICEHVWSSHVEPLQKESERLKNLSKAHEEYIKFLTEVDGKSISFLSVHGWHHSKEDIDRGVELRKRIEETKND